MQQTKDELSIEYDGTGFKSERSSSGSFVHQFTKPGTYYFSSGFLDDRQLLDMKGMVVVEAAQSNVVNIAVNVNGKLSCFGEMFCKFYFRLTKFVENHYNTGHMYKYKHTNIQTHGEGHNRGNNKIIPCFSLIPFQKITSVLSLYIFRLFSQTRVKWCSS